MRHYLALLFVFLLLVAPVVLAGGLVLNTAIRYETTDCSSGGSAVAVSATGGEYLVRVKDADVFFCYSTTCASGGEFFPVGTVISLNLPTGDYSCRSSTSTGDIALTRHH